MLSQSVSCDFINLKDKHVIYFIIFIGNVRMFLWIRIPAVMRIEKKNRNDIDKRSLVH